MSTLEAASSTATRQDTAWQVCIHPDCRSTYGIEEILVGCPKCGNLLDIAYDWDRLDVPSSLAESKPAGRLAETRSTSAASGDFAVCCRLLRNQAS